MGDHVLCTVRVYDVHYPDGRVYPTNVKEEIRDARLNGFEVTEHNDPRVAAMTGRTRQG